MLWQRQLRDNAASILQVDSDRLRRVGGDGTGLATRKVYSVSHALYHRSF